MAPPIKFRYEIQPIVEPGYGICPGCRTEAHLNCGYCADPPSCAGDHQRRLVGGIHRAVEHRCAFTWFDPFDIFELSNWRCYICDQAPPRSLYGKRDPLSPQLDHVIPLSRGGPHTPENAECVCARCNAVKGDRTL